MTVTEFLSSVEGDKMERLRWVVLKKFGIFPMSAEGKSISDEEILLCAAQMVLDVRENGLPQYGEAFENEGFDEERFLRFAEGVK